MLVIQILIAAFSSLCLYGAVMGQEDDPFVFDVGPLGRMRGALGRTYAENGVQREYIQLRGIPYATVPQRFAPSTLLENDVGHGDIFNATVTPVSCYQPLLPEALLSEDCLFLNVYTHQKDTGNDTELRPVIFFIHGGAFTVGQGATFSGIRIMNRDVVYVSFNYRLGLLGFLSFQNDIIPGNAAMYDVVNALIWTNKYIKHFGGDPNSITIAGQSAGSVTVTQLMVSPMAQGLFHRAIGASGSALNPWGTTIDSAEAIKGALDVSVRAGCYDGSPNPNLIAIGQCMRTVPASLLVTSLFDYQVAERNDGRLGFAVVSPVVQSFDMTTYPKFLPENPATVFAEGREAAVPLMMSTTKHDGSYVLGVFYNRFLKHNGLEGNTTFLRYGLVPAILTALGVQDRPAGIHETISRTYLGDARHSADFQEMYPGLMDIFSVFFFKGDCYNTALLHARNPATPTYWSTFDFRGDVSFWGQLFPGDVPPPFPGGITHTDDLIYIFALTFLPFTDAENAVSSKMMSYWADFATHGRPHVDWPQLFPDNEAYMIVDLVSNNSTNFQNSWVGPGYEAVRPDVPTEDPSTDEPTTLPPTSGVTGSTAPPSPTTPTPSPTTPTSATTAEPSDTTPNFAPTIHHTVVHFFLLVCIPLLFSNLILLPSTQ